MVLENCAGHSLSLLETIYLSSKSNRNLWLFDSSSLLKLFRDGLSIKLSLSYPLNPSILGSVTERVCNMGYDICCVSLKNCRGMLILLLLLLCLVYQDLFNMEKMFEPKVMCLFSYHL